MQSTLARNGIAVRPHRVEDIQPLFVAVRESVAEISPWLPWCHASISTDELASFVEISRAGWGDGSQYHFVIADASTGVLLGGISLNHLARPNRLANMGYWVRTSATRRGVASTAVRLVADFGFRELALGRVEIAAIPENLPSRRTAERAGAKFEGLARNRLVMHGVSYDAALYSIIPSDLGAAQQVAGAQP